MRRLRYSVAAALDGLIADPNGGYDWTIMDDVIDFAAIFEEFDAFVMGRKTWDVSATTEFAGHVRRQRSIVFRRRWTRPRVQVSGSSVRRLSIPFAS